MTTPQRTGWSLQELNLEIGEAEKRHDAGFLHDVLHEDLVFRRADGSIVDKPRYLRDLPEKTYRRVESEVIEMDEGQDSAAVSVLVRAAWTSDGRSFTGSFRNTRLFTRKDGRWQCLAWVNVALGPNVETLHHVSLPVTDLTRSRQFYRETLGLREIQRPPFQFDGAWYELGDRQLHLIVHDNPTFRGPKGVDSRDIHFAVRVGSFREALEFLESKGYREDADESDPKKMRVSPRATAGFPQIYILDPDRHVIEINAERLDS
jgi:glyoxylase I family protein